MLPSFRRNRFYLVGITRLNINTKKFLKLEQLDFTLKNYTGFNLTLEIFNPLNSFLNVSRSGEYTNPLNLSVDYKPYGIWTTGGLPQTRVSSLAFNQKGGLVITDTGGNLAGEILCSQYPYRSLLEALKYGSAFEIQFIRMKAQVDPLQLLQDVVEIKYTPLTNKFAENYHTPTIDPMNKINLLNDFKEKITIDATRGIRYTLLPAETVSWNVNFLFK